MNQSLKLALKAAKGLYQVGLRVPQRAKPDCIRAPDAAATKITELLSADGPVMIARFGSTELACIVNYLGVKQTDKSVMGFIRGNTLPWWWSDPLIRQINMCAGFFPADISAVERFCTLMLSDAQIVDLLGSWLPEENMVAPQLAINQKIDLELLNPYFSKVPWTQALMGKKVLVIHPFAETIEAQYKKRELIFRNNLLPKFDLITIKAVQSIAGEKTTFQTWFDALAHMQRQMDSIDYDICLVGCGAYGFPIAAHAKRSGKKGFHLGGSLQLLFGIRGKRWENPNYNPDYNFSALMNEHWVKPGEEDRPKNASEVEGACYW
jgi:hypothetical protein